MDSTEQANGEKRVKEVLIDPLARRGLAKPTSLTKAQFGDMVEDLCARLAYMTDANLMALEEQVAANAGGKEKDRFPIGQRVLEWAAQIQPPGDDASPLIRAVFAHALGQDAVSEGWAPELLHEVRKARRWPTAWVLKTAREKAERSIRRMRDLDGMLARGRQLTPEEADWRDRRGRAIEKCRHLAPPVIVGGGEC